MFREFAIAKERRIDDHDNRVTQAWLTAALNNQRKMPRLETLLLGEQRKHIEPQTAAQQRAVFEVLVAQYGGKVRKTRLIRVDEHGTPIKKNGSEADGTSHH